MKTSTLCCFVSFMLITFSGCFLFGPNDNFLAQDGNAGTVSLELSDMGDATMEIFGGTARGSTDDTVVVDITVKPWEYSDACQGWVREAIGTIEGDSITRYDTIWFYDANNNLLALPTMETLSHYTHVRSVNGKYYTTFDYRFVMNVSIEKGADTVFTFNGNITGKFDGEVLHTVDITNVKRRVVHTGIFTYLSYPYEGTISIDRPYRTIFIEFGGDYTAQVIVIRKSDGKTWIFRVNVITGVESA